MVVDAHSLDNNLVRLDVSYAMTYNIKNLHHNVLAAMLSVHRNLSSFARQVS